MPLCIRYRCFLVPALAGLCLWNCNESSYTEENQTEASALRSRGSKRNLTGATHFLVLDRDAIAAGQEPNFFSREDINSDSSRIGYRATLGYFARNLGKEITLPSGEMGDEGWFALTSVRFSWKSAGPDPEEGLRNYLEAGPGLGREDARGRKEFLLQNISNVTPLRATGLARLEGRSVCAVVLDGDVQMTYDPTQSDLSGNNLGKIAFEVISSQGAEGGGEETLPSVTVRILDADAVCGEPLKVFEDAPRCHRKKDTSDIIRPTCVNQRTLLEETWDVFNANLWAGDGDQLVQDGAFQARPEANSAAADYIPQIAIPIEATGAVQFSNRMQLLSAGENPFAESGALFMVNRDGDGSFNQYVFVNIGYTMAPSLVFVELFGSDNGQDFDQFEQTSLPYSPSQIFTVDLWAKTNSYAVSVAGEMIDTVNLANALPSLKLFEVGVQQNSGGLRGLVHATTIQQTCPKEVNPKPRQHWSYKGKRWKARVGKKCRTRNDYVRWAKEQIRHEKNPSLGMKCLARMKIRPEFD